MTDRDAGACTKGETMSYRLSGRGEYKGFEYTRDTIGRLYGIEEETGCQQCGAPLYLGDRALMLESGDTFCTDTCMEKYFERCDDPGA